MLDFIRDLWGTMINKQTTTFWESFATDNLGRERYPTRSYCHAWSAAPAYALSRSVLGARLDEPGGTRVSLIPQLDVLEQAEGVIPLRVGTIELSWQSESKSTAVVACNVVGDIHTTLSVPDGWLFVGELEDTDVTLGEGGSCELRVVRN